MPNNEVREGKVYRPRSTAWTGVGEYRVDVSLHPSQRWKVTKIFDWGYGLRNSFVTIYFRKEVFDLYFVEAKKHERK